MAQNLSKFTLIFLLFSLQSLLYGTSLETHGYMRSGVGTNSKGGDQVCFSNPGTPGNEFRLGNECGTYGELAFKLKHGKRPKKGQSRPFFNTQIRLAFAQNGHTNWEGANNTNPIAIRETFFEGGGFGGSPLSFWAGKRFYRANDVYMNDFYYIFDMSGNGGGVSNIPFIANGNLSFAYLREISSTTSDIGNHGVTVFDARAKNLEFMDGLKLDLWAAYGSAPSGIDSTNSKSYGSSNGYLLGALLNGSFDGGFNHFALIYGKGLLDDFNLYGQSALEVGSSEITAQQKSNRLRLVEHITFNMTNNLTSHFSASLELRDNGETTNNKETWWNVGAHPVYFFNDHYQLAGVLGHSVIIKEGARSKTLSRLTIAPQVSISNNIWSRPILRAFYTHSVWSESNKGNVGGNTYQNDTSGASYGLQGEVWF